jgi:hypothetical protein
LSATGLFFLADLYYIFCSGEWYAPTSAKGRLERPFAFLTRPFKAGFLLAPANEEDRLDQGRDCSDSSDRRGYRSLDQPSSFQLSAESRLSLPSPEFVTGR